MRFTCIFIHVILCAIQTLGVNRVVKVFIDGREGTTGLRIQQRLTARPDIELLSIDEAQRKDAAARKRLLNAADIAFLCLPDAAAVEAVALVDNPKTVVVDASTAHRTLPDWAYGLPELSPDHRRKIRSGKRIAVPGCHASGFIALCYPLVAAGILPRDYPLVCHSVTGYTGGGKGMIAEYEASGRDPELSSPRQYGLSQQHKHLQEMRAIAGLSEVPVFSPIVADFPCGMALTLPLTARLLPGKPGIQQIRARLKSHYADQKLVRVVDSEATYLGANNLAGRDCMEISVFGNDERILLTARFDNLGKGASGAAVQCMNIALGLDETTGLVP